MRVPQVSGVLSTLQGACGYHKFLAAVPTNSFETHPKRGVGEYVGRVPQPFPMAITLTTKANTKTVMLQIAPDLYARIKVQAKRHNIPASAAMREILEQAINELEASIS